MKLIERAFELGAQVPIDGKASAAELGRAFQIEHAESFADFPVRLGGEVEFAGRAPAADFLVVVLGAFRWERSRAEGWECFAGYRRSGLRRI